jgi:hypothetical protein
MLKYAHLIPLLLIPAIGSTAIINVGGVTISIPPPAGYVLITPKTSPPYELQQHSASPNNVQFASFLPEQTVPAALKRELSVLPRHFTVQTAKTIVSLYRFNLNRCTGSRRKPLRTKRKCRHTNNRTDQRPDSVFI